MPKDLTGITFEASKAEDQGERLPRSRIDAFHDGARIGRLEWHGTTHRITGINVKPEFARRGIATEMWDRSQQMRPKARHSEDKTAMGKAWAASLRRRS